MSSDDDEDFTWQPSRNIPDNMKGILEDYIFAGNCKFEKNVIDL